MKYTEYIKHLVAMHSLGWLFVIVNVLVMICLFVLFLSIAIDFVLYHRAKGVKKKVNSYVETGTMFIFYLFYCVLLKFRLGTFNLESFGLNVICIALGLILIIAGTIVNVSGRIVLKDNWANQVTVYNKHTLVSKGVYSFVRHPLYASIIWMLVGGALVFTNYLTLLAVIVVFIPMMIYRAKQEEALLCSEMPEYIDYKTKVGMLLPKIWKYGSL